jgi:hypothetical protein
VLYCWPLVVERKEVIYNLSVPLEDPLLEEGTRWVGQASYPRYSR